MDPEKLRRERWFRALEIAQILLEDEGYHSLYLQDLVNFLKEESVYSPKIKEDLIPRLYHQAKAEGIPMTKLVDQILRKALNGQKPGRRTL